MIMSGSKVLILPLLMVEDMALESSETCWTEPSVPLGIIQELLDDSLPPCYCHKGLVETGEI